MGRKLPEQESSPTQEPGLSQMEKPQPSRWEHLGGAGEQGLSLRSHCPPCQVPTLPVPRASLSRAQGRDPGIRPLNENRPQVLMGMGCLPQERLVAEWHPGAQGLCGSSPPRAPQLPCLSLESGLGLVADHVRVLTAQ